MNQAHKTYKFHVKGMHCHSCVVLIEENLKVVQGVASVQANLTRREVIVGGNLGEDVKKIAENLTEFIKEHGYALLLAEERKPVNWSEFIYALPIAAMVIFGFYFLQKTGFVNLVNTADVSYGTAFFIGLIASISTCLAVVGGLVLSMSANYAREDDQRKPQMLFHAGRFLSFFGFGGIIGALGSSLHLGLTGNFVLSVIVALVMLILGINLLDVVHFTKRLQFTMPKIFAKHTMKASTATHSLAPLLVGAATFFLPCGFTQSMQVYALTTGSFIKGALTMLAFALGTFPMLALLSFGSFSISHKPWKGVFFKTAGLIVVALAAFNFINALVVAGAIDPVFNF